MLQHSDIVFIAKNNKNKIQNSEKFETQVNETDDDFIYQKDKRKKHKIKTPNQKNDDFQSFPGIETQNRYILFSQPDNTMSTRMVNLDNDYLSSSAPQEPMDIACPPQPPLALTMNLVHP